MSDGSSERKFWITANRITAVAAVIGVFMAGWAVITAKDQLFRTNRAWLAPVRATLDLEKGGLAVNKPLHLIVHHRNTGHEPATDFVAQQKVKSFPHPGNQSWYSTFTQDRIEGICSSTNAAPDGLVVYPSDKPINQYRLTTDELPITEKIMKGEHVLYVEGCFAYRTFGEEQKSAYCFMLIPKIDAPLKNWSFGLCPRGNTAN